LLTAISSKSQIDSRPRWTEGGSPAPDAGTRALRRLIDYLVCKASCTRPAAERCKLSTRSEVKIKKT
jgi:hypothetical protein